jgi:two-component sensor histidine kinase
MENPMARAKPSIVAGRFAPDGAFALRVTRFSSQLALAVVVVGVATALGGISRLLWPDLLPGGLLFPAVLLASLIGGWRAGVAAGVLSVVARFFVTRPRFDPLFVGQAPNLANLAVFILAAAVIIALGAYVRFLLDRLRDSRDALSRRTLHYVTLFETIPEGFAVVEAIRDNEGRLVDYTVVEINPALRRLLGVGPEAIGARMTDSPGDWRAWLSLCDRVLSTGAPVSFERYNPTTQRWHEVRVSRLTETRLAQFFFDITAHKTAETRQAEQLSEINHRVKNNLAMVASLLQLQARGARDDVRGELGKAAGRVQTIADIHAALTRDADADEIEFGAYLQDLCAGLRRSLAIQPGVTLTVETEPANLAVEAAAPLGMVVNELVTNAAKYAHPPDATGSIDVRFGREGEHLLLIVRDDGRGLPDPSPSREGALGMRLVRSLVASVGGELAIRKGEGACFEIRLKNGHRDRVA